MNDDSTPAKGSGRLAENIVYFSRVLHEAGLPVGPGAVLDAVRAVEAAGIGTRADFRATLHAIFVKKHEHTLIFDQAFDIFWRKRGLIDKLIAMMSPIAEPKDPKAGKAQAGATRISEAMFNKQKEKHDNPQVELDYRLTTSADELLQKKDFAQMTAEEIARARTIIARLRLERDEIRTRRFVADPHGARVDPRRTFRRSLRGGGASIELAFRDRAIRKPPIVAICDISGSMSDYTRIFLHFLHAMTDARTRVQIGRAHV